jgi:N-acetylgalactosamine-N,N'-diacetylbacillosaminyl-diphospho-undecaprenol 4-alpha-N-acetylgalactosaminyltransferase
VHHIIVIDKIEYEFAGVVLNLGKHKKKQTVFLISSQDLILSEYPLNNQFDFIIDFRVKNNQFQELLITKFYTRLHIL